MSVINKMLRDLDQHRAATSGQVLGDPLSRDQVMRGTQALVETPVGRLPRRGWLIAALVAALLLAGLLAWWLMSARSVLTAGQAIGKSALAVAALPSMQASAALAPSLAANAAASAPSTVVAASPALASPMSAAGPGPMKLAASTGHAKLASQVTTSASGGQVPVPSKLPAGPAQQAASAVAQSATTQVAQPAVSRDVASAMPTTLQNKPALDSLQQGSHLVLAQAQAMWNEGSRASAIALLRQALGRVEADSQGSAPGLVSPVLVALLRELARMELADAQVSHALKDLTRFELQMSQVADLWAMRGNAAQRLGQHAEAVSSYQRALGIKPDEPRWLLGLAVSLAAQGQTTPAADLAEKVRVMGALRPEIANYLRQLGVVIRTD